MTYRFGEKIIVTKGDANEGLIPGTDFPIREKDYIGTVAYVVPKVGLVLKYLNPPVNYIIIAGIVGVLIYTNFRKRNDEKDKIEGKDSSL
jgi:signal peptidase